MARMFAGFVCFLVATSLFAQKAPTEDDAKELLTKYRAERTAAVEQKFGPALFERADKQAARGEVASADPQRRMHQNFFMTGFLSAPRPCAARG